MSIFRKIRNHKVIKNMSWILAGRISNMILTFIVGVISARYLGPSNYGLIGYAGAFATFFASVCSLGINSIIVKELIDHRDKEGELMGTSIVLRLVSSFFSFVSIQIIVLFLSDNEPVTRGVVFLYNINLFFQAIEIVKYWFISRLQSKYPEIISIAAYVITSAYKIFLLVTGKDVMWFAFSMSLDYIVIAFCLLIMYKRRGGQKLHFSMQTGKRILKKSYHFILSGMMIAVYNSTDKLMLKQIVGEDEVGYYTAASTIAILCTFVYAAIIESVGPVIMKQHAEGNKLYNKTNRQLYAIIFYLSNFFALGISVFSGFIVSVLYGAEYTAATASVCLLSWSVAFSYLGVARDVWIVCEKNQKYLKYIYFLAAFMNAAINAILIPSLGATGASIATLATQIGTILIFPAFFKRMRPNIKLILDGIRLRGVMEKGAIKKLINGNK